MRGRDARERVSDTDDLRAMEGLQCAHCSGATRRRAGQFAVLADTLTTIAEDSAMHIAAMVLGILGGLSLLGMSLLGVALGAGAHSTALQVFSLAIPIVAFVGAGLALKNGMVGGILMLASAAGVLWVVGLNAFGLFLTMLLLVGGVLGLASRQTGGRGTIAPS